ncbi:MAG: aspartate aminotransferase family protein [Deltaproteobacteria bacterium]|nr:aspartate aminotransferase family protein [Deltaproteobacteria bacterium]
MTEDMTNASIIRAEDSCSVPSYAKWPVAFVRGEGSTVFDADGKAYLDLYGGHCVCLLGHSHPHWTKAVASQAERLGFYSNVVYNDVRAAFVERFVSFAPERLARVFLCNSGAEANETAVKLAMKATGRSGIVAMEGSFHGRTAGALSLTHLGSYRDQFPAVVHDVPAAPFGDVAALKALLSEETAAVILEPVQSMNGVRTAAPSYYRELVAACHKNGTLVIFDEIQTGFGRLGAPFAADLFDAEVDLITTAKGIGNGFPMAAVLATEIVSGAVEIGEQGTTFGGGPLACAAGLAVLEVIEKEGLVAHAAEMETVAREVLQIGPVTGVRGHGLLLGLETAVPAKELTRYLFERGIIIGTSSDPSVARLMPPLNIKEDDLVRLAGELNRFEAKL